MRKITALIAILVITIGSCSKRDQNRYFEYITWQKNRKDSLDSIRHISVDVVKDTVVIGNPKDNDSTDCIVTWEYMQKRKLEK